MDRTEFIEKLQRALAGGVNSAQVAENIRYYEEYINSELSKGRSEEEILAQLGDPRLLAKSIIEANKRAGTSYGSNQEYDEEVVGDPQEWQQERASGGKRIVLPGWLVMLIVTVLVLVLIGLATALLSVFGPVIIAVLVVVLVVKLVQGRGRQ